MYLKFRKKVGEPTTLIFYKKLDYKFQIKKLSFTRNDNNKSLLKITMFDLKLLMMLEIYA